MICNKCGYSVEEGCLFCTACGHQLGAEMPAYSPSETAKPTESFIDKLGDTTINQYLSAATVMILVLIRLLGRSLGTVVVTVLLSILNACLLYRGYTKTSQVNRHTLVWNIVVLVVGLLMAIGR